MSESAGSDSQSPVQSVLLRLSVAIVAICWLLPVSASWRLAPDLGHSWAVPLLMAYLWWERWSEKPAGQQRPFSAPRWIGIALILGALEIPGRLLLTPFPLWPVLLALFTLLFVTVAGLLAHQHSGWEGVRWVLGPMILLPAALPAPSLLESQLILPLRAIMATLAAEVSNLVGQPALASGTSIQLANTWVGVDEACGGIRSLQACVMIGLFFGEWHRMPLWKRGVLVSGGIIAAVAGNFGRVLFLSLRGPAGQEAVTSAHDGAGWVAMVASLALTAWLGCHIASYRWPPQGSRGSRPPQTFGSFRACLLVASVLAVGEIGTRIWYVRGETARSGIPQWTVALPNTTASFESQNLGDSARAMLRPDLFTAGRWQTADGSTASAYYVEWRRGQLARSVPFLHNPTVCLPLAGCELVERLTTIEVRWNGGTIPFQAFRFRRAQETFLVAFTIWDPAKGAPLQQNNESGWKPWLRQQWEEVAEARENKPAQLLTVALSVDEETADKLQPVLAALIRPTLPIK